CRIILSNPSGVSVGSVSKAVATIGDDNVAGQINFSASTYTISEGHQPTLLITRTGGSHGRVTVDYRVTAGTAPVWVPQPVNFDSGPNTQYVDFFGTITFEDGQTTAGIIVSTFDEFPGQE